MRSRVGAGCTLHRVRQCSDTIEHPADGGAIDRVCVNSESDDASSEQIHDNQDPMCPKRERFTTEEIKAPRTVFRMREKRQPRRPMVAVVSCRMLGQYSADHVFIDLDTALITFFRENFSDSIDKTTTGTYLCDTGHFKRC